MPLRDQYDENLDHDKAFNMLKHVTKDGKKQTFGYQFSPSYYSKAGSSLTISHVMLESTKKWMKKRKNFPTMVTKYMYHPKGKRRFFTKKTQPS